MIYPGITSPPFAPRSHRSTVPPPLFPPLWCSCCWIRPWTGSHPTGAGGSTILSGGPFCEQFQVIDPFPVTERLLCSFAAYMAEDRLSVQTYLAAVRNMQLSLGLPDPREQSSMPILKRVQAGISRARLGRGQPSLVRLPITASLLRRIKDELERWAYPEKLVLWAVCCTAFFGFFRLGELLLTSRSDFNPT